VLTLSSKKNLNWLLGLSLIFKLILAFFIPVFADEAYYYLWTLHPQLSYFDHPAMVSWFISLGHLFLPHGNPLALRISFVLASFIVSVLWVQILRLKNISTSAIFIFISLYLLNPLLGVGSIVATPDTPLVLFWSLSYYCYLRLLAEQKLQWYALLGVFLGLGFCSKYHIVLFVFSGLLYLIFSKKIKTLKPVGVLLTLLFGAVFSLPVLIWNAQNDWSSFLFQMNHGFGESSFEINWAISYVFTQIFLINPVIFISLFKKQPQSSERTFAFAQLGFFLTSSFRSIVEGNWPITSHLHATAHFSENSPERYKKALCFSLGLYFLVFIFLATPLSQGVKKNMVNSSQLDDLLPIVEKYSPLYAANYQYAALLSWKTQTSVFKLNGMSRFDFYDSLPESKPQPGRFYVLKYDYSDWPNPYAHYKKIKLQSFDNKGLELYQFDYE
jgi:4-amino-4-deoxy-L-arabinose transferase-like glycosyltransferase